MAAGDDQLFGGKGDDIIIGGTDNDLLKGDQGNDKLDGGVGNDDLQGGDGDDFLAGGFGNDILRGGAGKDTFFFASVSQGADTIVDFRPGEDKIKIDVPVDPATIAFVGFADGVSGPANGPALVYDHVTGVLSFSESAGASLVHVATLQNDPVLHKADVLLV